MIPVLYLNTDRRTDRRAYMEALLERIGWSGERFPARPPDGPQGFLNARVRSNWLSHMAMIERAAERPTLILEDDVLIPDPARVETRIAEALARPCDVVYLYGAQALTRIAGVVGMHGYVVRPESAPEIVRRMKAEKLRIAAGMAPMGETLTDSFFVRVIQAEMVVLGSEPLIVQDRWRWGSDTGWGWAGNPIERGM